MAKMLGSTPQISYLSRIKQVNDQILGKPMSTRHYDDMAVLRTDTETLIDAGRFRFTRHSREAHDEIPTMDKLAIVRFGRGDRLDNNCAPSDPRYICWGTTPTGTLCRGVYAIVDTGRGDHVVIITVFPEENE